MDMGGAQWANVSRRSKSRNNGITVESKHRVRGRDAGVWFQRRSGPVIPKSWISHTSKNYFKPWLAPQALESGQLGYKTVSTTN